MNQDLNKEMNSFKNSLLSFHDDMLEDRSLPIGTYGLIRVVTTKLAGCLRNGLSTLQTVSSFGERLVSIKI